MRARKAEPQINVRARKKVDPRINLGLEYNTIDARSNRPAAAAVSLRLQSVRGGCFFFVASSAPPGKMPQKKSDVSAVPTPHPRAGCTLPSSGKGRSPLAVCPLSERQGSEQATSCRSLRTSAAAVYAVSRLVVYIVHGLKGSGLTCTWGFAKIELERTIAFGRLKKSEWIMGACGALEGGLGVDANKTRSLVRPGMYVCRYGQQLFRAGKCASCAKNKKQNTG